MSVDDTTCACTCDECFQPIKDVQQYLYCTICNADKPTIYCYMITLRGCYSSERLATSSQGQDLVGADLTIGLSENKLDSSCAYHRKVHEHGGERIGEASNPGHLASPILPLPKQQIRHSLSAATVRFLHFHAAIADAGKYLPPYFRFFKGPTLTRCPRSKLLQLVAICLHNWRYNYPHLKGCTCSSQQQTGNFHNLFCHQNKLRLKPLPP
jgi:hypothetical protein